MTHDPRPQCEEHPLCPGSIVTFNQLLAARLSSKCGTLILLTRLATGTAECASTGQVLGRIAGPVNIGVSTAPMGPG